MELFDKKKSAKTLCKVISKVFNRPDFYQQLLTESLNDLGTFYYNLGRIIEYYIRKRDKNTNYTISEYLKKISEMDYFQGTKDINNQVNNSVYKGFLTHACNGAFGDRILKNGLGNEKNRDENIANKLQYLEGILGTSRFLAQQKNTADELYLSSPGASSIYYATTQSPERLFLGILQQDKKNALPIVADEKEIDYYLRLISQKISNLGLPNGEEIKKIAHELLEFFFSKRPIIVFIPIISKHYQLQIVNSTLKKQYEKIDIIDYIKQNVDEEFLPLSILFSHQYTGGWGTNNLDDIVIENTLISKKELGILSIPNRYYFLQLKAKNLGIFPGEKMDYFTGERVNETIGKDEKIIDSGENKEMLYAFKPKPINDQMTQDSDLFEKDQDKEIHFK